MAQGTRVGAGRNARRDVGVESSGTWSRLKCRLNGAVSSRGAPGARLQSRALHDAPIPPSRARLRSGGAKFTVVASRAFVCAERVCQPGRASVTSLWIGKERDYGSERRIKATLQRSEHCNRMDTHRRTSNWLNGRLNTKRTGRTQNRALRRLVVGRRKRSRHAREPKPVFAVIARLCTSHNGDGHHKPLTRNPRS